MDDETVRLGLWRVAEAWPGAGVGVVWRQVVAVDSDHPVARRRREREAERPVHPAAGPLRVLVLVYADGVADLVLVAERAAVSPLGLHRLADVLFGGPIPADPVTAPSVPTLVAELPEFRANRPEAAPDWALGEPGEVGRIGWASVPLPALPGLYERLLPAAVALVSARHAGEPWQRFAVLDVAAETVAAATPYGRCRRLGPHVHDVRVDEDDTVGRYLHLIAASCPGAGPIAVAPTEPGPVPRTVLITAADGADGWADYRPSLAPIAPLTLYAAEDPAGTPTLTCRHDAGLVDASVAERICRHVARVVRELHAAADTAPLATITWLSTAEARDTLRLGGVERRLDPASDRANTIHARFAATAAARPDAIALSDDDGTYTYRELAARADLTARGLQAAGAEPGDRIGVFLEPDAEIVVVLLAVLIAGCTYVPLDVRHPHARLRHTATDAGLRLVIGDPKNFPTDPTDPTVTVLDPATIRQRGTDQPEFTAPAVGEEHPAYVIYTSGSTGRPKGVEVPHGNVLALLDATRDLLAPGVDDVWTLFHSTAFDFSVWEIWGCLLGGGHLVVVSYWTARSVEDFYDLLVERRVTVLNQTPSAFAQLVEVDRRRAEDLALRLVVFGGEPLHPPMVRPWFERHSYSECRLVNMYGITETTVHVTAQPLTPTRAAGEARSVGAPLPGWWVSVRDPRGRVLPPGVAGELWVGGAGVAIGYLDRPEQTAERFVVDPLTGQRVYRSGDRGRLRADGRIDHLGRLDSQVKVRGYRIELGEIEAVLLEHTSVIEAAAVVRGASAGDGAEARIDAYLVLVDGGDPAQVLRAARAVLPEYMVPGRAVVVPALPLTVNGKVDTDRLAALSAPDDVAGPASTGPGPMAADTAAGPGTAAESATAATVWEIWRRVLGADARPDEGFFEVGGNSLSATRLLAELRAAGLPRITVRQFYRHATVPRLVALLTEGAG
ncbi:non-ribosomal peptide synthetase [Embleya hyalina]|uniref:non-ribosomal peptide synthetase n=1 Tax=Embleya hyalina TaxID=516124 RepID=UPI001FE6EE6C|nr:non-ribosomal peptide synthetase [Embleya hyalina]